MESDGEKVMRLLTVKSVRVYEDHDPVCAMSRDQHAELIHYVDSLRAENEALRADVVWAVRGYIRPIDDGQRLAIGIDPQTLFTRMVEWDGTDADILRAVREAREKR